VDSKADLRWALVRRLRPMSFSVIRRSIYSIAFFLGGHLFYYLTVLIANLRLDVTAFGRFYLGWAILNVMIMPGTIIASFLSIHFATVFRHDGTKGATAALTSTARSMLPWAILIVLALQALLYFAGKAFGADSLPLIVLLPITALSFVVFDIIRAVLQGMLRFIWFGISWLACAAAQCVLAWIGLLLIDASWTIFLAMLLASAMISIAMLLAIGRFNDPSPNRAPPFPTNLGARPALRQALPFCAGLGGVVLLHNVDVMVAYLTLNSTQFGVYTAAAVLPKAIVAISQPIVQIMLPVIAHLRGEGGNMREAVFKAVGMVLVVVVSCAGALWALAGNVCGTRYGIQSCNPSLMLLLATAAIPISLIRTLTVADASLGRYWVFAVPFAGLALFIGSQYLHMSASFNLAKTYSIVCWITFATYFSIRLWPANFARSGQAGNVARDRA
jgi:O-antigen/teichoic acid export membrane protein